MVYHVVNTIDDVHVVGLITIHELIPVVVVLLSV